MLVCVGRRLQGYVTVWWNQTRRLPRVILPVIIYLTCGFSNKSRDPVGACRILKNY
jgi:hypothetical protein